MTRNTRSLKTNRTDKEPLSLWILTHPRSGSNYLSHLFNNINPKYDIKEKLNKNTVNKDIKPFYPLFNKIIPFQMNLVFKSWNIDFSTVLYNLPNNIRWIYLKRRNLADRLTSWFISYRLYRWYLIKEGKDREKTLKSLVNFTYTPAMRRRIFNFVKEEQLLRNPVSYWDLIIKEYNLKPYVIYYEDMCKNRSVLNSLFEYCGFDTSVYSLAIDNNRHEILRKKNKVAYSEVKKDVEWALDKLREEIRQEIFSQRSKK